MITLITSQKKVCNVSSVVEHINLTKYIAFPQHTFVSENTHDGKLKTSFDRYKIFGAKQDVFDIFKDNRHTYIFSKH